MVLGCWKVWELDLERCERSEVEKIPYYSVMTNFDNEQLRPSKMNEAFVVCTAERG